MNAKLPPPSVRWLMLFVLGVSCLPLFAATAFAAGDATAMPTLHANLVYEFASDRARMIQVSLVFVALGCALMWWYK